MTASLHVLGGGPAGLAAAALAAARGVSVRLHEAGPEVGGNCRTLRIGACRFDTGAHRLHARDPEDQRAFRELLGDGLIEVDAPSRILRDGRSYLFPPAPRDLTRNLSPAQLARALRDLAFRPRRRDLAKDFRAAALSRYGETLAEMFLLGYTRKLWGQDPSDLSVDVAGGRLKGLGIRSLLADKILRREPRHLDGAFLYPREGIGSLAAALESRVPPEGIFRTSRVTNIRHDGSRLVSVTLNEMHEETVDRVVSTLPLPLFLRALDPAPPSRIVQMADGIAFRNLVLCALRLRTDRFSDNASLYFPGPESPFTRLYESKNRSPWLAPPGETCVVLEIPCDPGDTTWRAPDAEIVATCIQGLARATGFDPGLVVESSVHRAGHAYPVLRRDTATRVAELLGYCARFENLRLAGRNALFRYAHLHDMLRQGRAATNALLGGV